MKLSEPIGNAMWGALFLRLTLGGLFIIAGLKKLDDPVGFIQVVQSYNVLPHRGANLYAILLPYLEIGCGTLLVAGFWTTLGALIASALLASFIFAVGIRPNESGVYNKDLILLAAALSLMFSGSGAWSIDQFRRGGGK